MFGFNKKNTTEKVKDDTLDELDQKLQPFRDVKSKGSAIITELYKRHGIKVKEHWNGIEDKWLDLEVIKDLCLFTEQELASLEKWVPKYKEAIIAEFSTLEEILAKNEHP